MGSPVTQSIGGGGGSGSCCCQSWSQRLCYQQDPPPGTQYLFRENVNYDSYLGTYDPYTWDPDAPFVGTLADIPALVHGSGLNQFAWGNGVFNSTYTTFYTVLSTAVGPSTAAIRTTDYSDPENPSVITDTTVDGNISEAYSIAVDPLTDIVYISGSRAGVPTTTRISTINMSTGVTVAQNDIPTSPIRVIGFDNSGTCYGFDTSGNTYTILLVAPYTVTGVWSFSGSEYVYAFMGYAGSGYYGVVTYDGVTFRNRLIDITDGSIIDTLTDAKRGVFYFPSIAPVEVVPFTRVFKIDCDDVLSYTDRDIVTGEEIVVPEGATIGECP